MFAPAAVLEPKPPPLALEPEVPETFFRPGASSVLRTAATVAIA
jgi:hypothetical protein